jgi:CubicO group peptidase (beta-lactamase class C family)
LPNNLPSKSRLDPYAGYTPQLLYAFLSSYELTREPGAQYEYSNLGVGLLGHALSLHAREAYEQLVVERICDPLDMKSTRVELDDSMQARLAQGHGADGEPVPNWEIPTLTGAGGLRLTANDMLRFLAAYLGTMPSDLTPAMRLAVEPHANVDNANDIGLCWCFDKMRDMPWHNGQTGGYRSSITFDPKRKFGIVVLGNTSTPVVDQIAVHLALRLLGRKLTRLDLPTEGALQADAEQLCGRYLLSHQLTLAVTMQDGRLYCKGTGQPRCRMYPESADRFFLKAADAKIRFEKAEDGRITGLVLHQHGADQPAMRLP